jgi:hypothetical protein
MPRSCGWGGILLVSFGWKTGRHFWPPVLHLVYMLPLPGVLYFKLNTWLQLVSSELGVFFLQLANVPVFLEGKHHRSGRSAPACGRGLFGLRYLFPILSFSYIFAVLLSRADVAQGGASDFRRPHHGLHELAPHRGRWHHRASATAPTGWRGFTHFFEGWVIFAACVSILFALAWILLKLQKPQDDTGRGAGPGKPTVWAPRPRACAWCSPRWR